MGYDKKEYNRRYYHEKRKKRRWNPARVWHGAGKLLNCESLPQDCLVFVGKDISKERFLDYVKAIL